MATKIKDSATAKEAAMNLDKGIAVAEKPGEPNAPKEKTTTERLFPEFVTDDGGIINRPVKPYQDASKPLPAAATPDPLPQGQTPAAPAPTLPVYLKAEELAGKMVKLKVDGIEQDVPAESLIKNNQLERHLNAQLMMVAQERKAVEDERKRLLTQPPVTEPVKPSKSEPQGKKSQEVEALESQIAQMQENMARLQQTMLPAIQESGIKRVEQMAKERLGTDDFRSYFEKIRDSAYAELAKPENANNPQARAFFDSDAFYFQKYQEMKLKDLVSKPSAPIPNPNVPVLQTETGAPVVISNSGKPVSIPTLESSGGVPSKVSNDANWQGTYSALLTRAKESGSMEDWMAVYRHKLRPSE